MTPKKKTAATDETERVIEISRVLDHPRERVWRAWADPAQVVKWWGPRGFSTTTDARDFRAGGTWKHVMIGPDGRRYPNSAVFLEVVEPERIVYRNGGVAEGETQGVDFVSTVTFEDLGGKTRLTLRLVFDTAEMRDFAATRFGAVEGGKQTLARLAEHLASAPAYELRLDRLIDAPRERVWRAWADPEQVKLWFAPRPFTLSVRTMEFRTGGSFEMTMHAPDGASHSFSGRYDEVRVPERIAWSGEFAFGPKDQIRTTVDFVAEGAKTRVKVHQAFVALTPETEPYTKGAPIGWGMTLDQLAEVVTRKEA